MKCKFCGCTERRACPIPMIVIAEQASLALPGQLAEFAQPCCWIAPRICSAPACVEKAYAERCAEIDRLMEGVAA